MNENKITSDVRKDNSSNSYVRNIGKRLNSKGISVVKRWSLGSDYEFAVIKAIFIGRIWRFINEDEEIHLFFSESRRKGNMADTLTWEDYPILYAIANEARCGRNNFITARNTVYDYYHTEKECEEAFRLIGKINSWTSDMIDFVSSLSMDELHVESDNFGMDSMSQ